MSRFLVCSSALLGKPGSPGATGDLRDCITGVATLLVCVLRRKTTAMDSSAKNKPVIFQCRIVQTKREQRDVCIGNDASRVTKVGLVSCRNPPEEAGDRVASDGAT